MQPDTVLLLPYPPSANNLFPSDGKGRRFTSSQYRQWKLAAGAMLNSQRPQPISGSVSVTYELRRYDDNRRRDLANKEKALGDLLVSQQVIEDDSMIEELTMRWVKDVPWEVKVTISKAEP